MRASIGSTSGAVTAQMVGARAPSQRIRMVPVGAAYRILLPTPSARADLAIRHPPIAEDVPHAGRHLLGDAPAARIVGPPAEREHRNIRGRNDVHAEPRPPYLDERGVLPRGRLGPRHASMDREQRGSRHAVLEAGPRRMPQRVRASWEPLVKRLDLPPEREDLGARERRAGDLSRHAASTGTTARKRLQDGFHWVAATDERDANLVRAGDRAKSGEGQRTGHHRAIVAAATSGSADPRRRGPRIRRLPRRPGGPRPPGRGPRPPVGIGPNRSRRWARSAFASSSVLTWEKRR